MLKLRLGVLDQPVTLNSSVTEDLVFTGCLP